MLNFTIGEHPATSLQPGQFFWTLARIAAPASGRSMVRHPIGGSRSVIVLFVDPITCTAGGERRVVADHVRTLLRDMGRRRRISVAVIGSGVIGLTVASELQRRPVCGSSSSKSRLPVGGAINTGEYWLMVSRISATSPTVRAVIDPVSCRLDAYSFSP
jgi:hypothetical protein